MDAAKADLESVFQGLSMGSLNAFKLARAPEDAVKSLYGSAGEVVLYWAHHEKLCVIDRQLVFMGGLDMCKFDKVYMPTLILTYPLFRFRSVGHQQSPHRGCASR